MEVFNSLAQPYMIQDSWVKTVRYYNDMAWLYYSMLGMVPMLILSAYRLWKPAQDIKSFEAKENFNVMKNNMIETALTFYGLYYYVIDTVLTLVEGSYMEICRFALFSHHLPAIPLLYTVSKLNYKPWWALATAGLHSVLLTFPDVYELNFLYVGSIFAFHYLCAFVKPYNSMKIFQEINKLFSFMYIPLVILWWTDCRNVLPFV